MNKEQDNRLRDKKIILVGQGGSGKDYAKNLLSQLNDITTEISYTTRPPRTGEVGGKTYHFVTENMMLKMISEDKFMQFKYFPNGFVYGTTKEEFNKSNLFIMTPAGVNRLPMHLRNSKLIVVYINISDNVREERLSQRENADNVEKRMTTDWEQFKDFKDFDVEITDPKFNLKSLSEKIWLDT